MKQLDSANKETLQKFEKAQANLLDAAAIERKRMEEDYGKEKQLLIEELRVNEVLNK
jgi:hypothetical protein